MSGPVARIVLRIIAWLPLAFAVWYFAAPVILWPAKMIVVLIAKSGLADIVQSVEQSGVIYTFVTSLRPGQSGAATGNVSVDVNTLLYSFGLPLYAALVLAARE